FSSVYLCGRALPSPCDEPGICDSIVVVARTASGLVLARRASRTARSAGRCRRREGRSAALGRDREAAGTEDDLLVLDDQLIVQEELHCLREHLALERLAALLHLVERVLADADVEDVLQDHGPRVELLGDEVRRASRDPDALLPRLLVGVRS